MDTEVLIEQLAGAATPVRRLAPASRRTAIWLAIGVPAAVAVVAVFGFEGDLARLDDPLLWVEQVATLATALTAAYAAFVSTVPGAGRRWLWLPVLPLAIWLLCLGEGCLDDWRRLGAAAFSLRSDTGCVPLMVLIGVIPTAAMLVMLRRGAPLSPRLTLVLGTLAVAAFVNLALRFFHVGDVSMMVLVWHLGMVALFLAAAGLAGPLLLRWRSTPD